MRKELRAQLVQKVWYSSKKLKLTWLYVSLSIWPKASSRRPVLMEEIESNNDCSLMDDVKSTPHFPSSTFNKIIIINNNRKRVLDSFRIDVYLGPQNYAYALLLADERTNQEICVHELWGHLIEVSGYKWQHLMLGPHQLSLGSCLHVLY